MNGQCTGTNHDSTNRADRNSRGGPQFVGDLQKRAPALRPGPHVSRVVALALGSVAMVEGSVAQANGQRNKTNNHDHNNVPATDRRSYRDTRPRLPNRRLARALARA